ncbi:hypothetical protein OROGR_025450 [Orobanche gracilis]
MESIDEESTLSQYAIETLESKEKTLVLEKCRRKLMPMQALVLDIRSLRVNSLFLRNTHGLHKSIPRHITTFDEKYVLSCLESIRNCALRGASWNFTSKVDSFPDETNSLAVINGSNRMTGLAIEYPLVGKSDVIVDAFDDWTIGTLSRSQTMINILQSPLLKNFGSLDCDTNFRKTDLIDASQPFDHEFLSGPVHKRDASLSSTTSFQGMLQCTWKNGLPRHVFTVDDKREVYVAKLSKVESSDGKKGSDYIYTFHSSSYNKKECDIHELSLESIAKMLVSTHLNCSWSNSEIIETRFVLSVSGDNQMEAANQAVRKNKRLTKKVADIFKSTHSRKRRSDSKLRESSVVPENTRLDSYEDVHNDFLDLGPNSELAAIILKEVCGDRKEDELGGWGLKFLKRPYPETSLSTECSRDNGECSSTMDVIIPAGFHGGPRTGLGGPSGLTERWISGGRCDCGGWDIGCPLTILKSRFGVDKSRECKSVELFMEGFETKCADHETGDFSRGFVLYPFPIDAVKFTVFCYCRCNYTLTQSRSSIQKCTVFESTTYTVR